MLGGKKKTNPTQQPKTSVDKGTNSIESLVTLPTKLKYPRSQSLVPVLSVYNEFAVITKNNTMVMGLEIHAEDDGLDTDADVQAYYATLASFFSKLTFSYQICVYPRRQRIDAVLENYRKSEEKWQRRQKIAESFLACCQSFLNRAFAYCIEQIPNHPTVGDLEGILQSVCACVGEETTPMRFSDFEMMPGELPHAVLDFVDFSIFVYESLKEALAQSNLDEQWFNHITTVLGAPQEVIMDFKHILMRVAGSLALMESITDESLEQPQATPTIVNAINDALAKNGVSLADLESSIPGCQASLIVGLPRAASYMRKRIADTETAIQNYIKTSIEAINRIISHLVDQGAMLESFSLSRDQMVRSVLIIVNSPIGLPGAAKKLEALSHNTLESTYKLLKDRCDFIGAGFAGKGIRTQQLKASEILEFIKNIYNKDVVWRVDSEDRLGN